ncbi:SEC-C motif-containing protein [Kineosphaera limosa]|uniref:UPF0225 protein KILIM_035_00570 n=1 Tax=Kineosphaera limosa NBRC 100340 TaxID=1184609 RepID=K6VJH7_9MICO|nr:YchJ family metal-binding protein [Kineosphaera limosa]NYD99204.1 SEC-C motif-containing protein [Kineosphaera limosa]GAB96368.1 hypothetical protein KILIM_035_00570 [Kineosphaera limosa NBRC 100340]
MTGAFGQVGAFGQAGAFGQVGATGRPCPCGAPATYDACCGPLHRGAEHADTAEQLMRSRYSAFAVGESDYLLRTWHPRTRPASLTLDPRRRWTGLDVRSTQAGEAGSDAGVVSYRVRSVAPDGTPGGFSETARFARRGRRWVYVDGDITSGRS